MEHLVDRGMEPVADVGQQVQQLRRLQQSRLCSGKPVTHPVHAVDVDVVADDDAGLRIGGDGARGDRREVGRQHVTGEQPLHPGLAGGQEMPDAEFPIADAAEVARLLDDLDAARTQGRGNTRGGR